MPGTGQVRDLAGRASAAARLAAGDCCDDPDRLVAAQRGLDSVAGADVLAPDVDVHERPQLAALVEEEVSHRQSFERATNGWRFDLELLSAARLIREEPGDPDGYHSATSTESTAGRCRAASIHSSPSLGETKIEPLFVPK